ncbi:hypothetical protein [Nocardia sp. NBC_00511]|uniref:hypothetical protein n=1 Tax=Nocardia sp. NBC_00511 TaxID=2903591 RepID=UPI0030E54813
MAIADCGGPLRFAAVLAMFCCAPGLPLIALIRLPSLPITLILGISTSWATWLLLALAQITSAHWLPIPCALLISTITVAATLAYLTPRLRGEWKVQRPWLIQRLRGRGHDDDTAPPSEHTVAIGRRTRRKSLRPLPASGGMASGPTLGGSAIGRSGAGVRQLGIGAAYGMRWTRSRFVTLTGLGVAAGLLWWESRVVDLDAAGAYGLVGVLTWRMPVALVLIAGVFACALARRRVDGVSAAGAVALLVCGLYQLVSVADGSAVVGTGFVHVGFVDYLGAAHRLPPSVDARFSWSGFFDAAALIVRLAGLPDAGPLLLWAPAVITGFATLPLFVIARIVTGSQRLAWVSLAIYVCGNWFQQDYFAPQAIAIVMHFSMVAVLLWLLRGGGTPALSGGWVQRLSALPVRVPGLPDGVGRTQALALEFVLLFIGAATVVSHQLTPVFTIATLTLLALVGCLRQRGLPVALGIVFTLWLSYGAPDYWTGHLHVLLSDLGRVGRSLQSGVSDRVTGDPTYQRMQLVRIGWSGGLAVLAAIGLLLHRHSRFALAALALFAAPFTLIVAQSYGGEIVLRCFFYALPIMAPLAALCLHRLFGWAYGFARRTTSAACPRRRRGVAAALLTPAVLVAAVLGLTTRGLNTAFERNPADVAAAARDLLRRIPDGASVIPPNGEGVLQMARLTTVARPQNGKCAEWTIACVDTFDADYVFLSTTQQAALRLQWGMPPGSLWTFADELARQGRYRIVQRTDHVIVLERQRQEQ